MLDVVFIKTLPHLINAHVQDLGLGLHALLHTPQILDYLRETKFFSIDDLSFQKLQKFLSENAFYRRVDNLQQPGHYVVKGDLIYFWPAGYAHPLRASFFDEELESLDLYDQDLARSISSLKGTYLSQAETLDAEDAKYLHVNLDILQKDSELTLGVFTSNPPKDVMIYHNFDYTYPQLFWNRLDILQKEVERLLEQGYFVQIFTKHAGELDKELWDRLARQQKPKSTILDHISAEIPAGLISVEHKIAIFTDREIFGTIYLSQRKSASDNSEKLLRQLEGEIEVGDYVVHEDYGIGIYAGLTQEEIGGQLREYLELEFANEDKLLTPIEQVAKLTKFIGNDGIAPGLSKLGKGGWSKAQKSLRKLVAIKAKELVEHYARRELASAIAVPEHDSPEFKKFLQDFSYTPTQDQINASNEIIVDLTKTRPMNRLLVGDVGFGKTEVAMRAAFKMAEIGQQVAVLCPTTVLSTQHYQVFTERFKNTKFRIGKLSRFNTAKQNREVVDKLNEGKIDIVIGTHRLLSKDVKFKNLGLLIVDEEQRFGVGQKERIKQLDYGVHHLSISATPIPRTLSMALTSIQDISIITQAPPNRKPVETELIKGEWGKIAAAIERERSRGGQIYFVHNRVQTMPSVQAKLEKLVPGIKVIPAHGQMSPQLLDKSMTEFYEHKADVLLATTIIENGLDMPNVNTMIINKAEQFGLSQLYQLRGRVGRAERQAYCLLLTTKTRDSQTDLELEEQAARKLTIERLEALVESSQLGSGFSVASKDLEIRGAGDLLGEKQHGHITKVGYALYMQLLAQEIDRLKHQADLLKQQPEYLTI